MGTDLGRMRGLVMVALASSALALAQEGGSAQLSPDPAEPFIPERHPVMVSQGVEMESRATAMEGRIVTERVTQLQLEAEYNSQRLRLEAEQKALEDRFWRDGVNMRLCEGRVAALENIKEASESMVGISAEHTQIRKNVSNEWKDLVDTQVSNTQEVNGKIQDIMGKVQAELDAPSITRGNGNRMDAFVLAQDDAVTKLQEVLDIAPQAVTLNREKMERTVQSYKTGAAELKCPSCNATHDALTKSLRSLPATIDAHKSACLLYATPPGVVKKQASLREQMADLDTAHTTQLKEAAARMASLTEEKASLDELHRMMLH